MQQCARNARESSAGGEETGGGTACSAARSSTGKDAHGKCRCRENSSDRESVPNATTIGILPSRNCKKVCVCVSPLCLNLHTYLNSGEEFECVGEGNGRGSVVSISLCEETAEIVLHWKAKGIVIPKTIVAAISIH